MSNTPIPKELIGQNIQLEGELYKDDFVLELSNEYPVESIIGDAKNGILKGENAAVSSFIMGSPTQNYHAEATVLWPILYKSTKSGIWQPKTITGEDMKETLGMNAEQYMNRADSSNDGCASLDTFESLMYGMKLSRDYGMITPVTYKGNIFAVPTEALVQFFSKK